MYRLAVLAKHFNITRKSFHPDTYKHKAIVTHPVFSPSCLLRETIGYHYSIRVCMVQSHNTSSIASPPPKKMSALKVVVCCSEQTAALCERTAGPHVSPAFQNPQSLLYVYYAFVRLLGET